MRGVKSYAMLLCASSKDGKEGGVEFVLPPAGSQPGERIYFEGEKYESKLLFCRKPDTKLTCRCSTRDSIEPQKEGFRDYPTCELTLPTLDTS